MNRLVIYIHGKGGNAKEAEHDFRENYHYICKRNRSIPYGYAGEGALVSYGETDGIFR
ncbi:hypothetical protein [Agathobacter rectalis]|jgi:hypothetical protein|uniref:hypothetical protein n=1 Tax=Agathobacter rectalis TaxID=39491 RepID=UPI00268ED993|nr:hypothetical protein [Agathobacter rectalis]